MGTGVSDKYGLSAATYIMLQGFASQKTVTIILTLKRACMHQSTTYVAGFIEEQDYVTYYVGIIKMN